MYTPQPTGPTEPNQGVAYRSEQLNRFVARSIRSACIGLGLLYGAAAAFHAFLFAPLLDPSLSLLAALAALFGTVIFLSKRWQAAVVAFERDCIAASSRTSSEAFRQLAQTAQGVVLRYRFGPTFHFEQVDASIFDMTGHTAEEFYTDPRLWHRLVHSDDLTAFAGGLSTAGGGKPFQTRLTTKQGRIIWVEHHLSAISDEWGRTVGAECVALDITDRKTNEMAVLHGEERLRIALEAAGLVIWEWELETGCISWVPGLETLLGQTDGEIKNTYRDFIRFIHSDDRERVIQGLDRARSEGVPFESQFKLQRADGSLRWVSLRTGFFLTDRCSMQSMMGTILDIQQEKQAHEKLEQAVSLMNATLDSTPDGILATDLDGKTTAYNARFLEIWAIPATHLNSLNSRLALDIIAESIDEPLAQFSASRVMLKNPDREGTEVIALKDGRIIERSSQPQCMSGVPVGRVWTFRDVTQRVRAEEALRESEERYKLATLGANDGIWDWEIRSNRIVFSPRWMSMLGYDEGDLGAFADAWFRLVHRDDLERFKDSIQSNFSGVGAPFSCEHRMRHRDGSYLWMLTRGAVVRDADGLPSRMAGSQTDITQRKLADERLQHDAYHDPLTGLANRAKFHRALERSLRRNKEYQERFAVLFIDLDRFKVINDSLGHLVGDHLLIALGCRIESVVRPGDTVARLGGDEFIILLDRLAATGDAIFVAERILSSLRDPFIIAGNEVFAGASIGIALSDSGYKLPEEAMRDADAALYKAKQGGKARYTIFDADMHEQALGQLELERDLRHAVELNQLEVFFQPIVCALAGRLKGFEALVRWNHPTRGQVPPKDFIPLAEDTGLIHPIGQWVLVASCKQLAEWRANYPGEALTISVNISPRMFFEPALVSSIAEALAESRLPPDALHVEITEGLLMDPQCAAHVLASLKQLGVRIHLDDFGTGFSSLGYLQKYPVDTLKVDRSFTANLGQQNDAEAIFRAIVDLARNLGIGVIVEGVENGQQLALIQTMGCDAVQGFLFAQPLDAQAAAAFIESSSSSVATGHFEFVIPK